MAVRTSPAERWWATEGVGERRCRDGRKRLEGYDVVVI
jgi:hypothetical protein